MTRASDLAKNLAELRARSAAARDADLIAGKEPDGKGSTATEQQEAREDQTRALFVAEPVESRLALLDPAVPLLMSPVRIETKFERNGQGDAVALLLRVYPDQFQVDTHEPLLTEAEWQIGRKVWLARADASGPSDAQLDDWARQVLGADRAAHVLAQTHKDTPPDAFRPATSQRCPSAAALPEQWLAEIAFDGQSLVVPFAQAIPTNLPLAPGPRDGVGMLDPAGLRALWAGNLAQQVDGIAWMLDFKQAELVGMAQRIDLNQPDFAALEAHLRIGLPIDSLTVVGAVASQDAKASEATLKDLLEAHAYATGLKVLPQGAPTNRPADARRMPVVTGPKKPAALSAALGLTDSGTLEISVADRLDLPAAQEIQDAQMMMAATWRASFGHYARTMLGLDDLAAVEQGRRYAMAHLFGRGPLPVLHVGAQPYGVLPVCDLDEFQPDFGNDPMAQLVFKAVTDLRPIWEQRGAANGPDSWPNDPDATLDMITREAHPAAIMGWMGGTLDLDLALRPVMPVVGGTALDRLARLGHPDPQGSLVGQSFLLGTTAIGVSPNATLVERPFERGTRPKRNFSRDWSLDEFIDNDKRISFDAMRAAVGEKRFPVMLWREYPEILDTSLTPVSDPAFIGVFQDARRDPPDPVLLTLLRHGLFLTFEAVATELLLSEGEIPPPTSAVRDGRRTFPLFQKAVDLLFAGDWSQLRLPLDPGFANRLSPELSAEVDALFEAFFHVENWVRQDPDRAELLLREVLGLASYRLDAWMTSLATHRLAALRVQAPSGIHLGCYGRVEQLTNAQPIPSGQNYLLAPSLAQATSAAILRSAYDAGQRDGHAAEALALNLRSAPVRAARDILDGMQQGLPFGVVLGYRLERSLRLAGLRPDKFTDAVDWLRRQTPSVAGRIKDPERAAGAADLVDLPPTAVTDGLDALRRFQDQSLPLASIAEADIRTAMSDALTALAADVDAIADLCLAESVHQIANGNAERGGVSVDALSRGEGAPERFDFVDTPRSGQSVTHRVLVATPDPTLPSGDLADPSAPVPTALLDGARTVAAGALEPLLQDLAGELTGLHADVVARDASDPDTVLWSGQVRPGADLGLSMVDLLQLVDGEGPFGAEAFVRRLTLFAAAQPQVRAAAGADILVSFDAAAQSALAVMEALDRALRPARALQAADFTPSGADTGARDTDTGLSARMEYAALMFAHATTQFRQVLGQPPSAEEASDLQIETELPPPPDFAGLSDFGDIKPPQTAAQAIDLADPAALTALVAARGEGDVEQQAALRAAILRLVPFNFLEAMPDLATVADPSDQDAATRVLVEAAHALNKRLRARAVDLAAATTPDSMAEVLFGRAFPILSGVTLPKTGALFDALAHSPALDGAGPQDLSDWLDGLGDLRPKCTALAELRDMAEAHRNATAPALAALQLPHDKTARWAGAENGGPAQLSLVAQIGNRSPQDLTGGPVAGLLLDEWVETIPEAEETAALAFQADTPDARAPQVLLLAMTGAPDRPWTTERLFKTVGASFDLARIRAIEPDQLREVGLPLPMIHFGGSV